MVDALVTLQLPRAHVGQILDALDARVEAWRHTQHYFEHGDTKEAVTVEDCTDAEEAASIAEFYHEIINTLREHLR